MLRNNLRRLATAALLGASALAIGSVSLLADSVDFVEDTAVNLLIALALGWPLARRAVVGHVLALIILVPALVAAWQAVVMVPSGRNSRLRGTSC